MGKFLRRVAALGSVLILLEVVQKTVVLHHLLTFENQREDGGFPGHGPALNMAKSFSNMRNDENNNSSDKNGRVVLSNYTSDHCRVPPGVGVEGKLGFQALTKIKISNDGESSTKLLCIAVTDSTQHSTSLDAVLRTYAPQCDGFLAASNQTDPKRKAVNLYSSFDSDWDRLSKIWSYVRRQHLENYAAFHFARTSTYVIPANLKKMIAEVGRTYETQPMILGGAIVPSIQEGLERYCGGRAGYTVNKLGLNVDLSACKVESPEFAPDRQLGLCLKKLLGAKCRKTTDSSSALRYLEFGIDYHANWNKKVKGPIKNKPLMRYHGIYMLAGLNGISKYTVSISLEVISQASEKKSYADDIERFHAILTGKCSEYWNISVDALDESGNPGYIHDPAYLRRNLLPFTYGDTCESPFGEGSEGKAGYRGLKKIRIVPPNDEAKKVLCMVYTHSGAHSRVRAIAETYGPRCDGFMAASNQTDASIGAVNLLHEGPEAYKNMWLKVRSMFEYAYRHYRDDYDFFHIGGDDHYMIAENLKHVVSTGSWKGPWNQSAPLLLGGNMIDYPHRQVRYCGGGSGYTINRAALQMLVEDLFDTHHCRPHFQASAEDRIISACLASAGIECMDTNDESKQTRYHQADANFHVKWKKDTPNVWRAESLEKFHGITSLEGMGQISDTSVSFHLKNDEMPTAEPPLRRYHAILYSCCDTEGKCK